MLCRALREYVPHHPNTATAQELFNACAAHGGKRLDHSALVRALELLADHEIGEKAVGAKQGRRLGAS